MNSRKPFFTKSTVADSQPRDLEAVNAIRFISVSGTVTVQFDDGCPIPVSTGDAFAAPWPLLFGKVSIAAASGGSATFCHGLGTLTGGGSSAIGGGGVQSTSGNPEGVLNAASGQWAYDSSTGSLYVNPNSSGTSGWVQLIA